ncbi:MAG: hypothetical protein R2856_33215 [Caldilineaceae bacterium]
MQTVHEWITTGRIGQPMMARETMNGQADVILPVGGEQGTGRRRREPCTAPSTAWTGYAGSWAARSSRSAPKRGLGDDSEVEGGIAALLTFDNSAAASLIACAPTVPPSPLTGTPRSTARSLARLRTRSFAELSNDGVMIRVETHSADTALGLHYNFARQAAAFAAAIEQDTEPVITGEDGLAALEICLAIYEAAESGKVVAMRNA